jgi:hypothetical protein
MPAELGSRSFSTVDPVESSSPWTVTVSHTVASGSDRVLFVGVAWHSTTNVAPSLTWAGNAMTLVVHRSYTNGSGYVNAAWYSFVDPDVTTADVVATWSDAEPDLVFVECITIDGASTSSPVYSSGGSTGTSTTVSTTIATTSGMLVLSLGIAHSVFASDTSTLTPNSSMTAMDKGRDSTSVKTRASRRPSHSTDSSTGAAWTAPALDGSPALQQALACLSIQAPSVGAGGGAKRSMILI